MRPWAGWCVRLASPAHGPLREKGNAMPMNHRLLRPRRRITVPGAPTITVATEGDGVAWTAPASNGGKPINEYRIYQDGFYLDTVSGGELSWPYAASPGSTYEVSAVNDVGEGPKSVPVVAT